jgi:hypothetical protein
MKGKCDCGTEDVNIVPCDRGHKVHLPPPYNKTACRGTSRLGYGIGIQNEVNILSPKYDRRAEWVAFECAFCGNAHINYRNFSKEQRGK